MEQEQTKHSPEQNQGTVFDPPSGSPGEVSVPVGARLGRYEVHGVLGRGGMGTVYAAHDPVLDRKIALKVVRRRGSSPAYAEARDRMLREAQALAHLSHPNVVTIFDVTVVDDQLVLAMELVEGPTLRHWLDQGARSPAEILAMFAGAGAGLAAAHAAGIIHRDFKPSNVLIDPAGRPRVADFGLARFTFTTASVESEPTDAQAPVGTADEHMTTTGTVMGTPLYMAPEQRCAEPLDQRCDVFAFCVALYIALYGQRPFAGRSDVEVLRAQVRDQIVEPPRSVRVPRAVFTVLRQGLAGDRERRHATMDALLRALERAAGSTRRRTTVALAVVGALALGGTLVALRSGSEPPCPPDPAALSPAWDAERRASMAAAFEGSQEPYAAAAWARMEPRLDDYAERWVDARQQACRTTLALTARPAEDGDRMMACLGRRREELTALTEVLATARPEVVQHAVVAVADLVPPQICTADAVEGALLPEDPDHRARVVEFQGRLAGVEARLAAASYADALADAERLAQQAEALDHEPTRAEALFVLGALQGRMGEHDQGVATLEAAAHLASAQSHDRLTPRVAIELVYLLGQQLKRHEQALEWARHAEAATHRIGDPPAVLGRLLNTRGNAEEGLGRYEQAEQTYLEALELLRRADPESAQVARALNNLGNVRFRQGRFEEAGQAYAQAHAAWARALGPDHPDAVMPLNNLATVNIQRGDLAAGRRLLQQVRDNWERSLGPDHFRLATPINNLAVLARDEHDYETAIALDQRALEIRRKAFGSDHAEVAQSLGGIGNSYLFLERCPEAVPYFREALEIKERVLGPEHPELVQVLSNYALCQLEMPDKEAALPLVERGLAIREAVFGADSPELRQSLHPRAVVLLGLDRPQEAIESLEHALRLDAGEAGEIDEADIRFELARAYARVGRGRSLVESTAGRARDQYREAGANVQADEVEAWLAARERSPSP